MTRADVAIIGGGIVGLATAYQWTQTYPDRLVIVLEKEAQVAQHQTGHNSGVLHSGIYYKPGSLKAINCREGKNAMEAFCRSQGIAYDICGKVIVATDPRQLLALERIYQRGQQNGVRCQLIERGRLAELEPHVAGLRAIHVPEAGIVDFRQIAERLARIVQERGGQIVTGARVRSFQYHSEGVELKTPVGEFLAAQVVNCAGLHCDRVARWSGHEPPAKIVPFRGEYYELVPSAHRLCRNLIYPVPDPNFPFLGAHFTRTIDGRVECGPNAVLAFAREGYRKRDVNLIDLAECLTYSGFLRLARKYWRVGLAEMYRSISKRAFVRQLQQLVPEIQRNDLVPAPAGVRAQAVAPSGEMVDDFLICESDRIVNLCNAPSPAATSSLNIAKTVVAKLASRL
jgi:L-2-hydroxyglutarate oxidase